MDISRMMIHDIGVSVKKGAVYLAFVTRS